jgi:5-methylcytosine-specific restriction endonuclease McrA
MTPYERYIAGPEWAKRRQRVLERDGYRCRLCNAGTDEARLEVHHRTYPEVLGTEPDEDLITLCANPCHTYAEEARRARADREENQLWNRSPSGLRAQHPF